MRGAVELEEPGSEAKHQGAEGKILKTPLYDAHVRCGGRIVPFAGYLLPVQYRGVIAEHMAVREACGLFDVSHMGEVVYEGPDALANLQRTMTNDFSGMAPGRVRYSLMCNEDGGAVDDLVVCKHGEEKYLVVVNAANRSKDVEWMRRHAFGDVTIRDISDDVAQVALQGPRSRAVLSRVVPPEGIPERYYTFVDGAEIRGARCLVSRTGYTGELGYEIYMGNGDAMRVWEALMEAGADLGLVPAGLGARDTLRLEAGMPLYGHEMDEGVTPFEAGLGFGVSMEKGGFVGRAALEKGAPERLRVGLRITGRGIARGGEAVYLGGDVVGRVTSGTHCPYLGRPAAMAMLASAHTAEGTELEVDVRGRRVSAEVCALPFYKRQR
ncbi:MAG: glycine cleavage system aminomethyltransferase GcvT [Synergistaceae bacterium]|jgi:aminomethyltransferase|nr:glycine cleavage system aminomethyltransferase GcvT [Synergistaceae bacterium]